MIRIATIHYADDRWIDLQLRRLERHTSEPYLVYASLYGIDHRHHPRFHFVREGIVDPAYRTGGAKSNEILADWTALTEAIVSEADDGDLIVFLHGDAFPVAEWVAPVRAMLVDAPLAGIRRDEEMEPYPHPCFTVARVGFWREIEADWSRGSPWRVREGLSHNDLGTALLDKLEAAGIRWHPILRSNAWNPHPVWFGVYGGFIYHHGAGFRRALSLRNLERSEGRRLPPRLRLLERKLRRRHDERLVRRMFTRIRRDEAVLDRLAGR